MAFVLTVAFVTTIRLRSLEQQAQTLQLQTEQDRETLRKLSLQTAKALEEERRLNFIGSCTVKLMIADGHTDETQ